MKQPILMPWEAERHYNEGLLVGLFVGILGGAGLMLVALQAIPWLPGSLGVD